MNAVMESIVEFSLSETVDRLASVAAKIARLETEEKALKQELVASLQREIIGSEHKAVVCFIAASQTFDYKKCVEFLGVSQEVLSRFTKQKKEYTTVTLYGL